MRVNILASQKNYNLRYNCLIQVTPEVGFEPTTNGLTVRRKLIDYNSLQYIATTKSKV